MSWVCTAARAVGVGGYRIKSRPGRKNNEAKCARRTRRGAHGKLLRRGDVERDVAHLAYEIPLFEEIARGLCEAERSIPFTRHRRAGRAFSFVVGARSKRKITLFGDRGSASSFHIIKAGIEA